MSATTCASTWPRTACSATAQPVHLTPTEFKLLARLVRSAGQVVTHRQLLADVWGAEFTEHTHYLRLYMGQLRAKLEGDPAEPRHLLTEPGVGYRLADASLTTRRSLCVPDAPRATVAPCSLIRSDCTCSKTARPARAWPR